MVIGKIKPAATVVAQFAAGVEIEAIQHEGRIFMPVISMGEFAASDDTPTPPARKAEPEAPAAPTGKDDKPADGKKYTEDELMDMDTKDLLKLCKSMGIDPDKTEGKNTNKKLRLLVLDAQENAGGAEEDPEEKPAGEEGDELTKQIGDILDDLDAGRKNKKKAVAAICEVVEDADKDDVADLIDEFMDDSDADIDAFAAKIAKKLAKVAKPASKPAKPAKKEKKEELVEVEDLHVGDKVSVWWDDDNQDWFEGEVTSISKKGKVTIMYSDDTEEVIDPEVHTKIKLLEAADED